MWNSNCFLSLYWCYRSSSFHLFSPVLSSLIHLLRSLMLSPPSDLGGLSWSEQCRGSVWRSAEKPGVGDGPREPHCGKGAAGPFRQHPDALLCWGSLCPEWLCAPWWQDCHLESRVENKDRESTSEARGTCGEDRRRRKKALVRTCTWQMFALWVDWGGLLKQGWRHEDKRAKVTNIEVQWNFSLTW